MTKAEQRLIKLKLRYDENSRLISRQKSDHQRWGGFMMGNKNHYHITNPHRGILIGGSR